jgi:hypothetical protein
MVKTNIIALLCFVLIIGGGIYENAYMRNTFFSMAAEVRTIAAAAEDASPDTAAIDGLTDRWRKKKSTLHAFVPHNEIKEIEGILVESKHYIEYGEFSIAAAMLYRLGGNLEALPGNYSFSLGNIF